MNDGKGSLAGACANGGAAQLRQTYESPRLIVLGTLEALTTGFVPTGTDSVLPGSMNP